MHYIDIGSGPPIVMIHGFSDSTYCWHKNIDELIQAGFRLILVDQPGMGNSEMPPEPYKYSIENQSNAIIKLTELIDIDQFYLLGHSMGGGIALYISCFYPHKVTNTIVIDPVCFQLPKRILLTYPGMKYLASMLASKWAVKMALKDVYHDNTQVDDALIDEYTRLTVKKDYWNMLTNLSKHYFSDEFDRMATHYHDLKLPVLIIWGEQDKWVPLKHGIKLHHLIKGSQWVSLNDCGHNPHQECSTRVNSEILKFYHQHGENTFP